MAFHNTRYSALMGDYGAVGPVLASHYCIVQPTPHTSAHLDIEPTLRVYVSRYSPRMSTCPSATHHY